MTPAKHGDDAAAFTLTASELRALVAGAVRDELQRGAPLVIDKNALARSLGCSSRTIDKFRTLGLPTIHVGQLVRFDPVRVMAWLAAQTDKETIPANDDHSEDNDDEATTGEDPVCRGGPDVGRPGDDGA
jgi:phage terminase Nu1 subunit (DNA packaging protein)